VKGPNVMRGYLGRDDLTENVMRDGWYVTGDIAIVDEDGFVRITDRLSRFSKIGGEMVPHGRVEEALQEASGERLQAFAVTSVPDERKGERLAVLTTLPEARVREVAAKLQEIGLPNLFIPRLDHFVAVEKLPTLGTGKLDLREVRRIAIAALAPSAEGASTTAGTPSAP
jgi:acyl-[acyl-carrier-protein]-phospholipid O-acyltransferase/long-chain-fatty-acid--[acyl-carrier-protein] ligase